MDLGQIFTNDIMAEYMVSLLSLENNAHLLDPCFGKGIFIDKALALGYTNIDGFEIDPVLYEKYKKKSANVNLYNNDFLKADETIKYEGIVMNPPYIRQEKIDLLKPLGISKKVLQKNKIYKDLPNTANMYMYFIFKALEILKENGELVVIFPGSWLQSRSGRLFEKELYNKCSLIKQIEIQGDAFEKSTMVDVVILHLKKGNANKRAFKIIAEIKNGRIKEKEEDSFVIDMGFDVEFSEIGSVRRGLTTGCNEMYINPDVNKGFLSNIISGPKNVKGYTTKAANFDKILLIDKDFQYPSAIDKYLNQWKRRIKRTKLPKTIFDRINKNKKCWFEIKPINSKGIIFSYFVRNDMKFILNTEGYLVRDNFYIIYPLIDQYVVFALLNNFYTYYQLETCGKKYGAGLLKLQRYDIESLLFPNLKDFDGADISKLAAMGKKLERNGNKEIIAEITELISKYSILDYHIINEAYTNIRERRLDVT